MPTEAPCQRRRHALDAPGWRERGERGRGNCEGSQRAVRVRDCKPSAYEIDLL